MLVAINTQKERCYAWSSEKKDGPYFCPAPTCREELILKKGNIRTHHFAHQATEACNYSKGESELHHKCKKEIYEALKEHKFCEKCDLERNLGKVQPDISLYINGSPVAIEVQKSTIDIQEIIRRTKVYTQKKIYLVWIIPKLDLINYKYDAKLEKYVFKPKVWHQFLHQMFYGRLYIWSSQANVLPLHYEDLIFYQEERNWIEENYSDLEGTNWYQENHDFAFSGGYNKKSKTKKEIRWSEDNSPKFLHLADDFKPKKRAKFDKSPNWDLPEALLWIDKSNNWW